MKSLYRGLLMASALAALVAAPARADTDITLVDGAGWVPFQFEEAGSPFQDYTQTPLDFTFTLAQADTLRITDGYNDGDQFDVTINGVDRGPTSTPQNDGTYIGDAWSVAFFDSDYSSLFSHASYNLGPGTYTVTGVVTASPYFSGTGAIELGAVPEPSVWAMMLLGLGAVGAMLRTRRKRFGATFA